jgi:hypothetical protein
MTRQPPVLLHAPEWRKSDGKVPYHYADKPAGSRCLWTARWLVKFEEDGINFITYKGSKTSHSVTINDWEKAGWTFDAMSDLEIRCELEDLAARPVELATKAVELLLNSFPDKGHWRYLAETLLAQARQGYPEYVAPWHEPEVLFNSRTTRKGWESWPGKQPAKVRGVSLHSMSMKR